MENLPLGGFYGLLYTPLVSLLVCHKQLAARDVIFRWHRMTKWFCLPSRSKIKFYAEIINNQLYTCVVSRSGQDHRGSVYKRSLTLDHLGRAPDPSIYLLIFLVISCQLLTPPGQIIAPFSSSGLLNVSTWLLATLIFFLRFVEYRVVHSHWSRNVEAWLSLVESNAPSALLCHKEPD